MTVDEILAQVRKLPPGERRELVERAAREVENDEPLASEGSTEVNDAIWADMTDEEHEAFLKTVEEGRREPWRTFE